MILRIWPSLRTAAKDVTASASVLCVNLETMEDSSSPADRQSVASFLFESQTSNMAETSVLM
jgi:hypothetical protein